jgi:ribosomal protein L29
MSTPKNEADDISNMDREEIEKELREARARASQFQERSEKTTTTKEVIHQEGRVRDFFGNMGRTTAAVGGLVAGALLGVGGTVLYHKRATRTAVGSTGHVGESTTVDVNM